MKPDYVEFQDRSTARAYLITFRCYGTWLHGDERGSVDRRHYNIVGTPKIKPSVEKSERKASQMRTEAFVMGAAERKVVSDAITEVCTVRHYRLFALNVRSNHVHLAVGNSGVPERLMNSFKAYSTRALRTAGYAGAEAKVWSRHGSTRYLWSDEQVAAAVDYVVNGQGEELPEFDR